MLHSLVKLAESYFQFSSTYCPINVDRASTSPPVVLVTLNTDGYGAVEVSYKNLADDVVPILGDDGKPLRGQGGAPLKENSLVYVPASPVRSGNKVSSAFLVDKGEYVFGLPNKDGKDSTSKFEHYLAQLEDYAKFCEASEDAEVLEQAGNVRAWCTWLLGAQPDGIVGPDAVVIPAVNGVRLHEARAARLYHSQRELADLEAQAVPGTCLVCGKQGLVCGSAVRQPRLSAGNKSVALASLDKQTFHSYELGYATAATCPQCSLSVATAITTLATTDGHHYRVGNNLFLLYSTENNDIAQMLLQNSVLSSSPEEVVEFFDAALGGALSPGRSVSASTLEVLVINYTDRTARIASYDRIPLVEALQNAKRWVELCSSESRKFLVPFWKLAEEFFPRGVKSDSDKKLMSNYRKALLEHILLRKPLPSRRILSTVVRNMLRTGTAPKSAFFAGGNKLSHEWPYSDNTMLVSRLLASKTSEELMNESSKFFSLGRLVAVYCLIQEKYYETTKKPLPGSGLFRQSAFAVSRNPAGYLPRWEKKVNSAYWKGLEFKHRWAADRLLGELAPQALTQISTNSEMEVAEFLAGFRHQLGDGLFFRKEVVEGEPTTDGAREIHTGLPGF